MDTAIWRPSRERVEQANLTRFLERVRATAGLPQEPGAPSGDGGPVYRSAGRWAYRWALDHPAAFWRAVWDFCGVVGDPGARVVEGLDRMPGARWFPDARLNFAENLLRRRDDAEALVARNEAGARTALTFRELRRRVAALARSLAAAGVRPGDRVGGYVPNIAESVVAMLAATTLGATWTSCSPDFGADGAAERFAQSEPRVLFAADGYLYAGKRHDALPRVAELAERLACIERVVVVPCLSPRPDVTAIRGGVLLGEFVRGHDREDDDTPPFVRLPFDHPVYVLYSSGTTGRPKCIVHGAGGTLLQHLKELTLHVDLRPDDRILYFTTCGWMMWNWLVSALAVGATVVLWDGSPVHPGAAALWRVAGEERLTALGVSARYLAAAEKSGVRPRDVADLTPLRTVLSTGSPLAPASYDWVHAHVKEDVHLASISGGTDIVSCFVLGDPTRPVRRGEIQTAGLGMAVEVLDDDGRPVAPGVQGHLCCTRPFPSMPLGFLGDPDGARFRAAYFERFPGVWFHGDWAERTEHGGFVIHGRSDATLNPGGVRIGTAEIYRVVERFPEVVESLAVGQASDGDERIVLFVVLRPGRTLDDALRTRIRDRLRADASPRHAPARIVQVPDLPRTRSGKLVELAVKDVLHGRPVRNVEALANPDALRAIAEAPELRA